MSKFPGTPKQLEALQRRVKAAQAAEKFQAERERAKEKAQQRATAPAWARVDVPSLLSCQIHQSQADCKADLECEWGGGVLGFWKSCRTKDLKGQWLAYFDLFCDPAIAEKEGYRQEISKILKDFGVTPDVFGAASLADVPKAELCAFFARMNAALDELDDLPPEEQAERLGLDKSIFERGVDTARKALAAGDKTLDYIAKDVRNQIRGTQQVLAKSRPMQMLAVLLMITQAAGATMAVSAPVGAEIVGPGAVQVAPHPEFMPPMLGEVFTAKERALADPKRAEQLRKQVMKRIQEEGAKVGYKMAKAERTAARQARADQGMADTDSPAPLTEWHSPQAAAYYHDFERSAGAPIGYINAPGGIVIWHGDEAPFLRHELRDEYVPHRFPAQHHDFFTSFIRYQVPDDKVWDVLRLSGSVSYDPLKRELSARCASLEANIATLALATKIAEGEISIEEVHSKGVYDDYIKRSGDSKALSDMLEELAAAVERNQIIGGDYWPLAFPGRS